MSWARDNLGICRLGICNCKRLQEFVPQLAPAPRLRSETKSWRSWNFLWPQALPLPPALGKTFSLFRPHFTPNLWNTREIFAFPPPGCHQAIRAEVEERRQRSSEASRECQGLRKAVYLLIIGFSSLLSTKARSSPTPRYQCVLNAFSSH